MTLATDPPRLLIVDPGAVMNSRAASKALEELPFPKSAVDNPTQAAALLPVRQPAVIVIALNKATRDAAMLCANLRRAVPENPPTIVIISDKPQGESALVKGNDINALFFPPFNWSAIVAHLKELLDSIWQQRNHAALEQLLELGRITAVSIDTAHSACHISKLGAQLLNLASTDRELAKWDETASHDWRILFSRCETREQQRLTDAMSDAIESGAGLELEFELPIDRNHRRRLRICGNSSQTSSDNCAAGKDLLIQDVTPQSGRTNSDAVNRLMDTTLGLRRGDRVLQSLLQVITDSKRGTLLLIKLQGIANLHRRHGYELSGKLLRQFAANLEERLRNLPAVYRFNSSEQVLARMTGGEFIVVFPGAADDSEVALLLTQSLAFVQAALTASEGLSVIDVRFGIASWPRDGANPDEILQAGNLASQYFEPREASSTTPMMSTLVRAREQARLEIELQYAIEREQLQLHYQPKLVMQDGTINGFEALLRWQRGKNLFIPPSIFIPIAERTGLISTLGNWVIEHAVTQIARWRSEGAGHVPVAVNVSPQQFLNGNLTDFLRQSCHQQLIEPHFLQIEVTESCLIEDADATTQQLLAIRKLGHQLALDDFGTGYSSLSYLRQLPLDILKIDRSFITPIEPAAAARNLAFSIIGIGKSLGLKIVAEGVSAAAHWNALKQWQCDQAQGYLISQPVNAATALHLWRTGEWDERTHTFKTQNAATGS